MLILQSLGLGGEKKSSGNPSPTPTVVETPTPTEIPTPTPSPTIAPKPKAQIPSGGCDRFAGGRSTVTVVLQPNTGTMTGDTVIRIKPTGKCPNESGAVEKWISGGELSWTSPKIISGRYRIEVANGYYQGVVAREYDILPGHTTLTIQVTNQ